jgi:hypothetical protein
LRSSASRVVLAALALAAAVPPFAGARDVKVWPLFRYAHDETTEDMRWSVFGPLLEFRRTAEARDLFIRPLLGLHQRRGAARDDRADILYPLAASRWQDDYQSFRFLLFTYRTSPTPGAAAPPGQTPPPPEWTSRFTLFPFVFYRRSPERGTRLSVLPFYLDLDDFLGYEHVTAVMFPAYVRLTEPLIERRYYPFPFVSTVGGPEGSGFRIFPFYGETEIAGREHTSYVLWPFHIRTEKLIPGYGWERRRINFPVFSAIDGAGRRTRAYGLFAYTHTIDERRGIEHTGAPWPFVVRQRRLGEEEYEIWRAIPFYARSDVQGISSRLYAWPVYRRKWQDVDDFHYERRDVGLVLWRRQEQDSGGSGRHERLLTLFPVVRSEQEEWRAFGQAPALADSLMPKNRGIIAMWAPLWGVFRWDTRPDGTRDWNLLWGLVAREDGRLVGPWHLDLGSRGRAEAGRGG